ncbi:MAG: hypothetical protein LQ340_005636 [Diploschistes diacapsis]|nr:MAG: hypothetical protein LQ340_005636 [Diploschistes diacapsis]
MNPFRSRKKSISEADSGRPSMEEAPPVPLGFRGRTFRRKKPQPEAKKVVDIKAALPASDDFRTSLLMPNLSARFSMLREQDDPNTKIGKANDDSVLFPKRASRLNLFNDNDLSNIAEVASISDSIRPPFASERSNSYASADGYGTDDDSKSIMSRSRQVKGNKFFANRQKIYMIPTQGAASTKELLHQAGKGADKPVRSAPRAVYDADVSLKAFQATVADQGSRRASDDREDGKESSDDDEDHERRASLQHSEHNSKRETSSSTNSGPLDSRASTAATSIASQTASPMHGPTPNGTGFPSTKQSFGAAGQDRMGKGKRLYGQGIDQQIHEQQSSALHRLNSIQRPFGVAQSRSASSLGDRFQKPGQLYYSTNDFRAVSPVPASSSALAGFEFGTEDGRSGPNSREAGHQNNASPTPMSPPVGPVDPTLVAALEPNDVGKATASGTFNKPKTSYSDEQFAQRQVQLQKGRETPPPSSFSRPGAYNNPANRDRNGSSASQFSMLSTASQTKSQLPTQNPSASSSLRKAETAAPSNRPLNGAYLASRSESENGSEPNSPLDPASLNSIAPSMANVMDPASRHRRYEHDDQHPAFGNHLDLSEGGRRSVVDREVLPLQLANGIANTVNASDSHAVDSPTLPTVDEALASGGGLNDLIRGHLRNVSNTSSICPNSPPRLSHDFFLDGQDAAPLVNPSRPSNAAGEPYLGDGEKIAMDPLSMRARRILEQASQLKNASNKPYEVLGGVGADKVRQVLGSEAPGRSNETPRPSVWQGSKGHARGASTETQKEREDFANELADRRKQVQENLKNFAEESGSSSPIGFRNTEGSPARAGPLGLLKKASRGSLAGKNESTSKAMKMLGVAPHTALPPSSTAVPQPAVVSPDGFAGTRPVLNSDIRQRAPRPAGQQQQQQHLKVGPGSGPSFRDRSAGAERNAGFLRGPSPPSPNLGPERATSAKTPSPNPNGYGFARSHTDNVGNQQNPDQAAARSRKYSPPGAPPRRDGPFGHVPQGARSASAHGHYSPANQNQYNSAGSYFPTQPPRSPNPQNGHFAAPFAESPRASPITGTFPTRGTPPGDQPLHLKNGTSSQNPRAQQPRKRSINKEKISNPTFVSGTSSLITVDLPPGASLTDGVDQVRADAPPVPPINPRRRKGAPAQNFFTSFVNRSSNNLSVLSTPSSAATSPHSGTPFLQEPPHESQSTFSSDESESRQTSRPARLRKVSSDGGNMAARARNHALKEMDRMPVSPMYAVGDNSSRGMF